jgi:excisionase family DNA binding protein
MREAEVTAKPIAVRPREAGQLVGLSERKVRELIATGAIRSVKIGGSRLIPYAALEAWLAEAQP